MNIFLQNKYTKWYLSIISAPDNSGYTEQHHIIPVSLGGPDIGSNKVKVSARKHFILHRLLVKMVSSPEHKRKMSYAVWCMTLKNSAHQRSFTSRQYEIAKKNLRSARVGSTMSEQSKQKLSERQREIWSNLPIEEVQRRAAIGGRAHANKLKSDPEYAAAYSEKQSAKRFTLTEEQKAKKSAATLGKPKSEEAKQKYSELALLRPKLTCQHCGKKAQPGNFARWHGVNCKSNTGKD